MNELTLVEMEKTATHLLKSGYFKDIHNINQAVTKMLAGQALGLNPFESMNEIYIIPGGKIQASATLVGSKIKENGKYDFEILEHTAKICRIKFMQFQPIKKETEFSYSIEEAQQAGLAQKANWKKTPKNMVFARCLYNGARWFCPDVFFGNSVYDEYEAEVIQESQATVTPPLRAKKQDRQETDLEKIANLAREKVENSKKAVWLNAKSKGIKNGAFKERYSSYIEEYDFALDNQNWQECHKILNEINEDLNKISKIETKEKEINGN